MSDAQTVDFLGETFAVPERINRRLIYQFAGLASKGATTTEGEGALVYTRVIDQCIDPADLARFDALCDEKRPTDEELLAFVADVLGKITDRPTVRPSGSSDGPSSTAPNSEADLSSQVIVRQVAAGRPDLALMVMDAQAARSA